MIFGIRPVIEAIEADKQIERIYVKKGSETPILNKLIEIAKRKKLPVQYVPIEKLNRLTPNNHQGVIAQIPHIVYADITEIISEVQESGEVPLIMVLDNVTDVRNFGAIARSAECAGVHAIVVSMKNSAPVNAESIKSSAGALYNIPICRVGSIRNALKLLQQHDMQLVAASEKSDVLVYDANLTGPTVIVMGSEDKGISKETLKICDCQVAIPLQGTIESLNVSAAAAVLLFETVRQRTILAQGK